MPPTDDGPGESFRGLVLQLRGRTGLTQRELAAQLGVHVHSIQGWEAGATYPGVASLQALIAAGLGAGGFTAGREAEEAAALWSTAMREAPRLRTPFDRVWFDAISGRGHRPIQRDPLRAVVATTAPRMATGGTRRESWGEAPDIVGFLGRAIERERLARWVVDERCRVITLLGLGGLGKSLLATCFAHDLAPDFDRVIWRGLLNAPTPGDWLAEVLGLLAPDDVFSSGGEPAQLRRLLELLSETRCLLVLDNYETVLEPGDRIGGYRPGFERYGTLLRQFAEMPHRSCLVVTSREEPPELAPLLGERGPVRALHLGGLEVDDGRALLSEKGLDGDDAAWRMLVMQCGGNGLGLKVIGEMIRELFGGSIADYLEYAAATSGVMVGGIREVLETQIRRLTGPEQELLRWLAIERETVGMADLGADLGPSFSRHTALEAMEGLRRRSLLEQRERRSGLMLQPVVLEYVTEQLIEEVTGDLTSAQPTGLHSLPLVKATARDSVRRSQEHLIAAPLLERLVATTGSQQAAERRLLELLNRWRARPLEEHGFGPGNLVNLLRLLRGNLRGVDLSGLAIRQAFLQDVEAQDASLEGAHLFEAVFGEAFADPARVALSSDGAYVTAGTSTGEVCVWRVADRTLLATLRGHSSWILGVALRSDGQVVAAGGYDGAVHLWETSTGRLASVLEGHTGPVYGVALSGDGRLAASGSIDRTVKLWDPGAERLLTTLQGTRAGFAAWP